MKQIILAVVAVFIFSSCDAAKRVTIELRNASSVARRGEVTFISGHEVANVLGPHSQGWVVRDQRGREIPSQMSNLMDNFLFLVDVGADTVVRYTIERGTPSTYPAMAYGRMVPERKDDWAWENDKVAFRIYGPALEATGEVSNGIDTWLKGTSDMVLDQWYKPGVDYHTDHGQGLDCYKVGRTLGAGAMAPVVDGRLVLGRNFVESECIDNGPLRHTFRVSYAPYEVAGRQVIESRLIILDAGSHFNLVGVSFTGDEFDSMDVAAGVVLREGGKVASTDRWLAYSEPEASPNGTTYLGLIMGGPATADTIQNHAVMKTQARYSDLIWYLTGSGWSKGVNGGFATAADWEKEVSDHFKKIDTPLIVKIIKR